MCVNARERVCILTKPPFNPTRALVLEALIFIYLILKNLPGGNREGREHKVSKIKRRRLPLNDIRVCAVWLSLCRILGISDEPPEPDMDKGGIFYRRAQELLYNFDLACRRRRSDRVGKESRKEGARISLHLSTPSKQRRERERERVTSQTTNPTIDV